jgi:hypothetical protein
MIAPALNARAAELQRHDRMNAATNWRRSSEAVRTAGVPNETRRHGVPLAAQVAALSTLAFSFLAGRRTQPAL